MSAPDLSSLPEPLAEHVRTLREAFAYTSNGERIALDAIVSALIGARGRAEAAQRALETRSTPGADPMREAVIALVNQRFNEAVSYPDERFWLEHLHAVKR